MLEMVCLLFLFFTSVVKSQSGDGVRRFFPFDELASFTDGDELGSSGITANLPRWTHGDVGPYVTKMGTPNKKLVSNLQFLKINSQKEKKIEEKSIVTPCKQCKQYQG